MPVTMPGSAIGSSSTNETASRPKNRNRWTAKAASVPRTSAIAVAPTAAWSVSHSASRIVLVGDRVRRTSGWSSR